MNAVIGFSIYVFVFALAALIGPALGSGAKARLSRFRIMRAIHLKTRRWDPAERVYCIRDVWGLREFSAYVRQELRFWFTLSL